MSVGGGRDRESVAGTTRDPVASGRASVVRPVDTVAPGARAGRVVARTCGVARVSRRPVRARSQRSHIVGLVGGARGCVVDTTRNPVAGGRARVMRSVDTVALGARGSVSHPAVGTRTGERTPSIDRARMRQKTGETRAGCGYLVTHDPWVPGRCGRRTILMRGR